MNKVTSKAKSTVINIVKVPQTIGRTILSVPEKILKKSKEEKKVEPRQKFADKLAFICGEIIEEQKGRQIVRESQLECMREITNHLKMHLVEHPSATYEEWIAAVHPDNAEYSDGRIDHRFYVEDSDHRILWNKFMKELEFFDSIIEVKSVDPSYNRT